MSHWLRASAWLCVARALAAVLTVSPLWLWLRGSGARGLQSDERLLVELLPRLGDAAASEPNALRAALAQAALWWLLAVAANALCERLAIALLRGLRGPAALADAAQDAPIALGVGLLGSGLTALCAFCALDSVRLRPFTAPALALPLTLSLLALVLLLWLLGGRDVLLCPAPSWRERAHATLRALHEAPWRLIGVTLACRGGALLLAALATVLLARPVELSTAALALSYAAAAALHALAAGLRAARLRHALTVQRAALAKL